MVGWESKLPLKLVLTASISWKLLLAVMASRQNFCGSGFSVQRTDQRARGHSQHYSEVRFPLYFFGESLVAIIAEAMASNIRLRAEASLLSGAN